MHDVADAELPVLVEDLLVRDLALVRDQAGLELNVGFHGIHLRGVAEAENAAKMLLPDRRANLPGRRPDDR